MYRRMLGIAVLSCLTTGAPTLGQNQQFDELLKKGRALLESLPEIPSDLDKDYYYKYVSGDEPVGWQHIKLDTITKGGDRFYRYRTRFGFNGTDVGWSKGEMMVIMDRQWTPIEVTNKMEVITAADGKREVNDRARIKNDKFQRRIYDGRQTKKFKFEYDDVDAVFLAEPLLGHLNLEAGAKFAMTNYDVMRGRFETTVYEVEEETGGRTTIKTDFKFAVIDPSKTDNAEVVDAPPPEPADKEDDEEEDDEEEKQKKKDKKPYMIIDKDKALRFQNFPRQRIKLRRIDRDRLMAIKKKLKVSDDDVTKI